ncbi:MAG: acyl-CoA thioesterase II [Nocardioides sp.]
MAAQALIAGSHTVPPEFSVHSLHSYFLRPGDTSVPIVYDVEVLRDGRSFCTRRSVARQHGRPIYYQTANYQIHEDGFDHQDTMPDVVPPEDSVRFLDLIERQGGDAAAFAREWASLDIRFVGASGRGLPLDPHQPAQVRLWMRVAESLADEPLVQCAAFTYASDLTLLGATLVPHGVTIGSPGMQVASLDHTIWFHRPFRADDWWLYDQWSPSASGARGLSLARVFSHDGTLVATVAQEGLIRQRIA